ncbi:unnamed protein product, partial [Ascophyllum nodosum]
GAYPPDEALPGSPRQCSLPLACRHTPKGIKLELGMGENHRTPSSTIPPPLFNRSDRLKGWIARSSQLLSRVGRPYPPERPSHTRTSNQVSEGERHDRIN